MGADSRGSRGLAHGVVGSARVIAFGVSTVAPAGAVVGGLLLLVSYAGFASPLVVADFYARGHIRAIAKAGADPGPLMSDYDAVHRAPQAATAADLFPAATPVSSRGHPRRAWAVVMAGPALAVADYHVLAGSHHATGARGPPRPGCAGPATTAPGSPRRR